MEPLECRRLLAAAAWNVSFDDPGGGFASYYEPMRQTIQAAGADWAGLIQLTNSSSIEVVVDFRSPQPRGGGGSVTTRFVRNNGTYNVFEQGAAAELKSGTDPNGAQPDIRLTFEPAYVADMWFDPNPSARQGVGPTSRVDAYSVMLHELGHAIAYNGWRDWGTYQLPADYASTFDVLVSVQGGVPYFTGARAQAVYGARPALTAGNLFHWGNPSPQPGSDLVDELMNGVVFFGGTKYDLSPLDAALLQDVLIPADNVAPAVASQSFLFETGHAIRVAFSESVRTSIGAGDLTVTLLGSAGTYVPTAVEYDRQANVATFRFSTPLPDGRYRATIGPGAISDVAGNALAPPAALEFFVLAADANRDLTVNHADFAILQANDGLSGGTFSQGNFNYDAVVDAADRDILFAQFGKTLLSTPGSIAGRVFEDANGNGTFETTESGIAGRTVYLEVDGNGVRDPGEPSRVTDATGAYSFSALGPGNYAVRQVVPAGSRPTTTAPGAFDVVLAAGQTAAGRDFGTVVMPAWLSPASAAAWNPGTRTLTVTGAATVVADPGPDSPVITADGAAAVLTIDPSTGRAVHVGGLTLTGGATATLASVGSRGTAAATAVSLDSPTRKAPRAGAARPSARPKPKLTSLVAAAALRTAANSRVLVVNGDTFDIDADSKLDLADNNLILNYSGASPAAGVEGMVKAGFNGGNWLGKRITSSSANTDRNFALAVSDNSRLVIPFNSTRLFAGEAVDTTAVLVKFTHRADLDLDGVITTNDATIFNSNYSEGGAARWGIGDVDFDGLFTSNDATIFNSYYDESLGAV